VAQGGTVVYSLLAIMELGFSLILFLMAWLAARQALRLRRSGTAERLHRKTRKLLMRTGVLTITAFAVFGTVVAMVSSLPSIFWEDRLTLNMPLVGAPLLAIWFTTVPMLWTLWKQTGRTRGVLDRSIAQQLGSRLFVLPYQATALGAATSFYITLISPIPYDKWKLSAPLAVYILVMIGLWLHHDRRLAPIREWLRSRHEEENADPANLQLSDPEREPKPRY